MPSCDRIHHTVKTFVAFREAGFSGGALRVRLGRVICGTRPRRTQTVIAPARGQASCDRVEMSRA